MKKKEMQGGNERKEKGDRSMRGVKKRMSLPSDNRNE